LKEACTAPVHFHLSRADIHHAGRVASLLGGIWFDIDPPGAGAIVADMTVSDGTSLCTHTGLCTLQGSPQGHSRPIRGAALDSVDGLVVLGRDQAGTAPVYFSTAIFIDHAGRVAEGMGDEWLEIDPPSTGIRIIESIFSEIAFLGTGAVASEGIRLFTGHILAFENTVSQGIRDVGWCFTGISAWTPESCEAAAFAKRFAYLCAD
jgi:hypothetical protein